MDTPNFCVYNLARRVFLSSKATVADAVNQPLKVLKDLVALESGTGLWLTTLVVKPNLPKLFPYDLAYLDKDLQVVETAEILPGVDFPAYRREVTSAVVLPPDTLRKTQTRVGDHLAVGRKDEIDKAIARAGGLAEEPVSRERSPIAALETPVDTVGPSEHVPEGKLETAVSAAVLAGASQEPAQPAAAMRANAGAETERRPKVVSVAKTPTVSITEVVIEKPHDFEHPVQPNGEHRAGLEDLFANWVDSPAAPPSWIAQKAREREVQGGPAVENPTSRNAPAEETPKAKATPEIPQTASPDQPQPVSSAAPVDRPASAAGNTKPPVERTPAATNTPVAPQIPQRPQATTFTIGQHGIWQLSTPTTLGPKRMAPNSAGQSSTRTGAKRAESPKPQGQTGSRRNGELRSSLPVKPKQAQTPPPVVPVKTSITETASAATAPEPKTESTARKLPEVPSEAKKVKVDAPGPEPVIAASSSRAESAPITPAKETPSVAFHADATIEKPQAEPPVVERTKKAVARPTSAEFASNIQERLEKVQAAVAGTADTAMGPPAASEKKIFSDPPPAKKDLAAPATPPAAATPPPVAATPQVAATSETHPQKPAEPKEQHELAVTLPLPRFLKPKPEQKEKLKISIQRVETDGKNAAQPDGFGARLKRWLKPAPTTKSDRRRAHRRYVPGMVAHYYTGGAPVPHEVADISMSGFYLLTQDRWVPETMIQMTLQKPCAKGERKQSIAVLARVVRRGSDGVGAEFVMPESLGNSRDVLPTQATDRFSLARFL
jgi:hypothetical protein